MMEINGGTVDKKKERSGFDTFIDAVGYAFNNFVTVVNKLFS